MKKKFRIVLDEDQRMAFAFALGAATGQAIQMDVLLDKEGETIAPMVEAMNELVELLVGAEEVKE